MAIKVPIFEDIETLSKSTILILGAIYVCGFLTVSLHYASFGFTDMSPFKPRILTAGFLFFFFISLPVIGARRILVFLPENPSFKTFADFFLRICGFLVLCQGLRLVMGDLFEDQLSHLTRLSSIFSLIGISGSGLLTIEKLALRPRNALIAALGALTSLFLADLLNWGSFAATLDLWFFGVGIVYLFFRKPEIWAQADWERIFFPAVITAIVVFSTHIYPNLKASWGGGAAVRAVIYLSDTSAVFPNEKFAADIIEESDSGYYLSQVGDFSATVFLPRNMIKAISYTSSVLSFDAMGRQVCMPPRP